MGIVTPYTLLGYKASISKRKYPNGRVALEVMDAEDGMRITVASVNLPSVMVKEDEVAIKHYGENQGILKEMIDQGIISEPLRYEPSGYVDIPVCKLLI